MGKDYILRLIEQVAAMLAVIAAKRKSGDRSGAQREINDRVIQQTGLPVAHIRGSTPEAVAELLKSGGELRYLRSVMLAELLIQDAEICEELGQKPEAFVGHLHAYRLLRDSIEAFNDEERRQFSLQIEKATTRLHALGKELGFDPQSLLAAGAVPSTR